MAKRGPKSWKIHDPKKIKAALNRGIKHGLTLYGIGCRCDVCRTIKCEAQKKLKENLSFKKPKDRKNVHVLFCDQEVRGKLPVGAYTVLDLLGA